MVKKLNTHVHMYIKILIKLLAFSIDLKLVLYGQFYMKINVSEL